ncbi:MAG TPA: C4-type zinc ribbon domain-containing protein [Syntrophales bacterium]|nr:C4-type zinc ribbon domain-containing protein [Syntrophales bacterium]
MKEQLSYLIELQKMDSIVGRIVLQKRELPEKIAKMDEELAAFTNERDEGKKKLEELNRLQNEKDDKLKKGIDTLKKTKDRLLEVKTNKEYQAILIEIETLEKKNSSVEDEIISGLEEIDHMRAEVKARDKNFEIHRRKYEEDRKKIDKEIGELESDLAEAEKRTDTLRKQITERLLKRYETIKGRRNGVAVVSVWKEVCAGCHMNIPPQLYIELQKSEELLSCPNCNRIIFWVNQGEADA